MNTTQIFVEQVFIGLIFLTALLLPIYPELAPILGDFHAWASPLGISVAVLAIGIAYLFGIVFDRVADSLLGVLEQHRRLRFALDEIDLSDARWKQNWIDPFPEDNLRIRAALEDSQAFQKWIDYLRIRLRLTRSLTVFLPGLTFSIVILAVRIRFDDDCRISGPDDILLLCAYARNWCTDLTCSGLGYIGIQILVWSYVLAFVLQFVLARIDPASLCSDPSDSSCIDDRPISKFFFGMWRPPKTNKAASRNYARARRLEKTDNGSSKPKSVVWDIALNPLVLVWVSLAYITYGFGSVVTAQPLWSLAPIGFALTALSGWAWWRTMTTFMAYLKAYQTKCDTGKP